MRLKNLCILLLPAICAVGLSVLSTRLVYRCEPVTSDENAYEFQARCFAEGLLRRPYPFYGQQLRHFMLIMDREHGWLSRYPPGHALWLTPGVWLGHPRIMVPLAAGLSTLLLLLVARRLSIPVWLVWPLIVFSPFFITMHGTLLSHTSGLLAVSAMLWAWFSWRETRCLHWAVLAGLFWAFFFINRTYTATLVALPFGVSALLDAWRFRSQRRIFIGVACFAGAALLGPLLYHGYNYLAVGDFKQATFLFYEPSEGLGFGLRHTQRLAVEHTLSQGLAFFHSNVVALDLWLWGFRGGLIAALALCVIGFRKELTLLALSAILLVWVAYIGFWFWGVEHVGGPVYYFETMPFIILCVASGLDVLRRWLKAVQPSLAGMVYAFPIIIMASSALLLQGEIPEIRQYQLVRERLSTVLNSAPPNSMVFIENLGYPRIEEVVFNPRGLDSDPLLLAGLGEYNSWLAGLEPDRKAFVYDGRNPERLIPLIRHNSEDEYSWPATRMRCLSGENFWPSDDSCIRMADSRHAPGFLAYGLYLPLQPGRYEIFFEIEDQDQPSTVTADVTLDYGSEVPVSLTVEIEPGTRQRLSLPLDIDRNVWIEPRLQYHSGGRVIAHRVGVIARNP